MELILQKTFTENYVKTLRDRILAGVSTEDYKKDVFPYDEKMVRKLVGVYQPKGLLEKMDAQDDLASAKALYSAYEYLPLSIASNENFWVYLTHVDLFSYVKERWLERLTRKVTNDYIYRHWFYSEKGVMNTTLMGLWWSVFCSIDEERGEAHKYDLTDMLFKRKDFQVRFGSSVLFRHKEAVIGILEYLYENPEIFSESTKRRGSYITRYFNQLGAVKELAYFNRDFFKDEMSKIRKNLLEIRSSGDNDEDEDDENV
jgi:hypothetical protein